MGSKRSEIKENSAMEARPVAFSDPSRSDDGLRKVAGSATGISCKLQLRSLLNVVLTCSLAAAAADSWQDDFSVALGASHDCALQKAPQAGATSRRLESEQIRAAFANEKNLGHNAMKRGYARNATASTQHEVRLAYPNTCWLRFSCMEAGRRKSNSNT